MRGYLDCFSEFHGTHTRLKLTPEQVQRIALGHDAAAELTEDQQKRARRRLCGLTDCQCSVTYALPFHI